jgi:hypothetical protein
VGQQAQDALSAAEERLKHLQEELQVKLQEREEKLREDEVLLEAHVEKLTDMDEMRNKLYETAAKLSSTDARLKNIDEVLKNTEAKLKNSEAKLSESAVQRQQAQAQLLASEHDKVELQQELEKHRAALQTAIARKAEWERAMQGRDELEQERRQVYLQLREQEPKMRQLERELAQQQQQLRRDDPFVLWCLSPEGSRLVRPIYDALRGGGQATSRTELPSPLEETRPEVAARDEATVAEGQPAAAAAAAIADRQAPAGLLEQDAAAATKQEATSAGADARSPQPAEQHVAVAIEAGESKRDVAGENAVDTSTATTGTSRPAAASAGALPQPSSGEAVPD